MPKSFCMSCSSLRDKDRAVTSCSCEASSFYSCAASASSAIEQADFHVRFFLCIEVTDTDSGWFSGSAALPMAGVSVAIMPVTRVLVIYSQQSKIMLNKTYAWKSHFPGLLIQLTWVHLFKHCLCLECIARNLQKKVPHCSWVLSTFLQRGVKG